jgi:hypothetical protein
MSAGAADVTPTASSGVLVSHAVLDKMQDLPHAVARSVAEAIVQIPVERRVPIRLDVPGDPPGTRYFALIPRGDPRPVVIYREALRGENGRWLVTALMDQDAYDKYRHGLADDVMVQALAGAVAAGTVTSSLVRRVVGPITPGPAPTGEDRQQ